MKQNSFPIERRAALAPMAGVTDSAYRQLCMKQGALFCVSEMISAKALVMGDKKTPRLMEFSQVERPYGIQLFGAEPSDFQFAARFAEREFQPDFIDINMGCPAPKITGGGAGSALMQSPDRAARIIAAVADCVSLPVTVKIRAGYHAVNAPDLAPLLEQAGAALLTIHGRTRDRMYKPPVDLAVIRAVRESVSIPVVGNGDIFTPEQAVQMLTATGCAAVMVGRGALGNPFFFRAVNAALSGGALPPPPSVTERMAALRRQAALMCESKGEYIALRELRKQAAWYTRGLYGAAALRARASELETLHDLEAFIALVIAGNPEPSTE